MICVPFNSSRNQDRIGGSLNKTAHNLTPSHMDEPVQGQLYFVAECFSLYLSNFVS